MLITEKIIIGDKEYIRTYSDQNMMIRGGYPEGLYSDAVDPVDRPREYIETDVPILEEDEIIEELDI